MSIPAPAPEAQRPDFFIVGAFKSGTTALYEYLRRHPQIFMPFHKEPSFFGDDLTHHYGRLSAQEYLALFQDARPDQRKGEASTWYLYSASAPREIADFSPGARIIVMLRNPIDVMYAQHSQLRFRGDETLQHFEEALSAEPARQRGEGVPPPPVRPETLLYRQSVRFAEQLQRYFDVFGRDRVHVILYDDIVSDPAAAYRAVLEFLDVDPSFQPEFRVYNENKRVRSQLIQRLVFTPPRPLVGVVRRLRRYPAVHRLRDAFLRLNSRAERRRPMNAGLRQELLAELDPEIQRLQELIGRDLSAWRS